MLSKCYTTSEPCVAGVCTLHADSPPSSSSEEVKIFPRPISQNEGKPTGLGRARDSKHTIEGDGCLEEGNIGTSDITRY